MTRLILFAGPVLGAPRISSKPVPVNSSALDEAKSARKRLFGVMRMSGLMKSRFICLRRIERITVIESEHGRFGKQAVVNTKARLFRCEMQKRNVRISRDRVVKNGMPVSKGPAAAVLAGQSHRCSFQKERAKGERFGKTPIVRATRFEDLAAAVNQHPFYFRKNIEILRHARETIDDFRERLRADGGRCG